MATNLYKVIGLTIFRTELNLTYEYITNILYSENATKNLMKVVDNKLQILKNTPKIYSEINKLDDLKRRYRRIPVKNYVLLYTIDDDSKAVYVSHMYYGRRNYMIVN